MSPGSQDHRAPNDIVDLISDVLAVDPMLVACANTTFVAACVFGAITTMIEAFYIPRSFGGSETIGICGDPFPAQGIVNLLCQAPVWSTTENLFRSCLYGAAWAISDPSWCFSNNKHMTVGKKLYDHHIVAGNVTAWCANITATPIHQNYHDDDYASRVAACVLAPLYHVTTKAFDVETGGPTSLDHRPNLVHSCQSFCDDLAAADDPAIQAVVPICATDVALCKSLDGESVPGASFVPTNLFERPGDEILPSFLFVEPPHRVCGRSRDDHLPPPKTSMVLVK